MRLEHRGYEDRVRSESESRASENKGQAGSQKLNPQGYSTTTIAPRRLKLARMRTSLLTAVDSTSHIHLIIGSNSLASSRATKSLEVGAKPIILAPEGEDVHFGLQKRIDDGEVQWVKKKFEENDLWTYGREEINGFVDAVFVASGGKSAQGE